VVFDLRVDNRLIKESVYELISTPKLHQICTTA
jgi:hypothetical protein